MSASVRGSARSAEARPGALRAMTADGDLAQWKGYGVEIHDRTIGSVAAVLPRAGRHRAGVLLVQTDSPGCSLTAVPAEWIAAVDPTVRRVVLRSPACQPA